ncbi:MULTISPECIES: hypothetical protein [Micromonospora]|jgi:hypothetical protein|uniref:Uncharacterized protein n=1 Tax=Micromonospora sicca TaxID=2202420 RepID=A0ABU5J7E1_9ACTN|nr:MULTISPECIES: hypothetical protein [unclassified Micromonospora]MBM0228148.1 hypothetical protein [Micromonospora sp. ATA51]MDZ5446190.1 hypothetical protein [Micromonospora sp. 4G57]MDZ5488458.1 hypothetical protein [Micromonospora sp. 4G53]
MSARRLGRLLGTLLTLAALVALPASLITTGAQTADFDWQMPVVRVLLP